jgi:hypothetical protein
VRDNETLDTLLAQRYGVPPKQLLVHNFATTEPEEINWCLRYHVGCKLTTHDHLNWRFSDAADPGLIYIPIPQQVILMDPITIVGRTPPRSTSISRIRPLFLRQKSSHGTASRSRQRWRPTSVTCGCRPRSTSRARSRGGVLKTSLKRDAIKLAIEQSTFEDMKASFGVKIDEKSLKPVADAVANGSKQDLIKALLKPFEASIKSTYRWGKFSAHARGRPGVLHHQLNPKKEKILGL